MHIAPYIGTGSPEKRCDCVKSFLLNANASTSRHKTVVVVCALFIAQLLGNSCGKTVVIVYVLDEYAFCATLFSYFKCNMCYVWLSVGVVPFRVVPSCVICVRYVHRKSNSMLGQSRLIKKKKCKLRPIKTDRTGKRIESK